MTAPNKMAKRAAAGTLALAVCLTGGVLSAGAAQADANFTFERVAGDDRFGTAVDASKMAYDGGSDTVIVVNHEATVDGLSAAYAASLNDAPILYVRANEVPKITADEISRLKADKIIIIGGTARVSNSVESSLKSGGKTVTRYAGADRFETAAEVAMIGDEKPGKVLIASGYAPADALALGPIAFAKGYPIVLVESSSVPAATRKVLSDLDVDTRVVAGGNTVVSASTYDDVDATERLSGEDRQGTAVEIADYAVSDEGFDGKSVALVGPEDSNTADALIAAPLAGKNEAPILFTGRGGLTEETGDYLRAHAADLTEKGFIFGGTAAVSELVATDATDAARGDDEEAPPASSGTIALTSTDTVTQVLASSSDETAANANSRDDNRIYTATGLTNGTTYRITLVDSASIKSSSGAVTFLSSADPESRSKFSVDTGSDNADIVRVNGAVPAFETGAVAAGSRTVTAVPANGTITFEIDGTGAGSVTPVIYLNGGPGRTDAQGGTSIRLETSATAAGEFAAASEAFGLGGIATYTGPAGANGAIVATTVAAVDKEGNFFSTDTPFRYNYDDGDTFTVNGANVNLAAFESQLSSGDGITGTYAQDARGISTFTLTDDNPGQPTMASAVRGGSGATSVVTVTGTFPGAIREVDQLVVQRAAVSPTNGTVGDFATIDTVTASDVDAATPNVQFRYVDRDVPTGTYQYRVAAINDGDQSVFSAPTSTVGVSAGAPTVLDTRIGTNTSAPFSVSAGDTFTIAASEDLAPLVDGDALRVQDADGTVVDFTAGTGANATTFVLNTAPAEIGGVTYPAARVITVTVGTTGAVEVEAGDVTGLGLGATITNQSGITDRGNTSLVLTGDVTIDQEG